MGNYGSLIVRGIDGDYDNTGYEVSGIGDINGDGFADFAVAAKNGDSYVSNYGGYDRQTGTVFVVYGSAEPDLILDLSDLDGTNGFEITSDADIQTGGFYGRYGDELPFFGDTVSALGDVNGDGVDDFAIVNSATATEYFSGEYAYSQYGSKGVAYVIYGGQDVTSSEIGVASLDHTRFDAEGRIVSVVSLGDLDGDGFGDIAVNEATRSDFVYFDRYVLNDYNGNGVYDYDEGEFQYTTQAYAAIDNITGYVIYGTGTFVNGIAIAEPGGSETIVNITDISGDAGFSVDAGTNAAGGSYVGEYNYDGGFGVASSSVVIGGGNFGTYSNYADGIVGAADINGDGFADIIVARGGVSADDEQVIRSGSSTSYSGGVFGYSNGSLVVDGSDGTQINGVDGLFGVESLTTLGDVSGDDDADEMASIEYATSETFSEIAAAGFTFGASGVAVLNGASDLFDRTSFTTPIGRVEDGDAAFYFQNDSGSDGFQNFFVEGILDVGNMAGDATDDFLILGQYFPENAPNGIVGYLVTGTAVARTGLFDLDDLVVAGDAYRIEGVNPDFDRIVVAAAGDVNGDGFDDIIIGEGAAEYGDGEATVIFGGAALEASDTSDGTNDNRVLFANTIVDVETGIAPIEVSILDRTIFGEEGTNFDFTVTRSGDLTAEVSVDYSVSAGGSPFFAINADETDFVGGVALGPFPSGTVTFAEGESTATISIAVADDTDEENNEDFTVTLSDAVTDNLAPISIGDEEAGGFIFSSDQPLEVFLSISGGTVGAFEGDPGETTDMVFRISRTGETGVAVSVDYRIVGNGADADDFVSALDTPVTVQFAENETFKDIIVQVRGDAVTEGDEFFQVLLENPDEPDGVITTILDAGRFGEILDDDVPAKFDVQDGFVIEGGMLTFNVFRSGDTSTAASVDYSFSPFVTVNNRAGANDFVGGFPGEGTLNFNADETLKQISVQTVDDAIFENVERINLELSNPIAGPQGAEIGDGAALGTIGDNEIPVSFRISSDSTVEGDPFEFTVTRTGDTSVAASVDYTIQPYRFGNSANDADISGTFNITGSLSFDASETTKTITLDTIDDTAFEGTEYLEAVLTNPSSPAPNAQAVISQGLAYGYLYDNDTPVYFSVRGTNTVEGDAGDDNQLVFTITRSGDVSSAGSVQYNVAGGTATADDFDDTFPTSGTIFFDADQRSETVSLTIEGDSATENDEFTYITLLNPTSSDANTTAILSNSIASAVIRNDDNPAFISVDSYTSVVEGDAGEISQLVFTVRRSGDTDSAVTVNYNFATDNFTPLSSSDIVGGLPSTGTVDFASGDTFEQIRIDVVGDDLIEDNERGRLTLTSATATGGFGEAQIVRSAATGVVVNDDLAPRITVMANGSPFGTTVNEGNSGLTPINITFTREGGTASGVEIRYRLETDVGSVFAADSQDVDTFLGSPAGDRFVTFAEDEMSKTVTVNVIGDGLVEANESFRVSVKEVSVPDAVTYDIATPTTVITIRNDDGRPPIPELPFDVDGDGVIEPGEVISVEADVFGDPHIVTLDGLGYDFQAVGDYVLVETIDGVDNPFSVQVRFEAFPGSDLVSVTTRMAVEVNGAKIEIDALNPDAPLLINGIAPADNAFGTYDADGDGTNDIFIEDGKYFISLNGGGDLLMVGIVGATLNVCVFLADPAVGGNAGQVQGLMGNANQDLSDDFGLRDGSEIPETEISFDAENVPALSFDFLYGFGDYEGAGYRGSWAVGESENLFSGDAPYFPPNFPAAPLSLDNLPADLVAQARDAAIEAGLDPEDDPVVFENAVLDFALTGLNDFLAGATQLAADPEVGTDATDAPDLPSTVSVAADASEITEGDTGVQTVTFTFTRTVPDGTIAADLPALTVNYALGGNVDATDLAEGTPLSGQVAFDAGDTQTTLQVIVTGDLTTEDDEALSVSITGASADGVLVAGSQGVTTVLTDDVAPEAEDDGFSTTAGANVTGNLIDDNGQGADSDADNDRLAVTAIVIGSVVTPVSASPIDLGDGIILTIDDEGNFTLRTGDAFDDLAPGAFDTISFGYLVSDGNGGTDSGTATVSVQGVAQNAAPVVTGETAEVDEDRRLDLRVIDLLSNDNDPEGGPLSIVSVSALNGTVGLGTPFGGNPPDNLFVTYQPTENYNGPDIITYVVSDEEGNTTEGQVEVNVMPVNDNPIAVDDFGFVTNEDTPITLSGILENDSDIDGDSLTVEPFGQGLQLVDGELVYTPSLNANGTFFASYLIRDGNGGADTGSVQIEVLPVNDAPTALSSGFIIASSDEDTPISFDPFPGPQVAQLGFDVDGDALTLSDLSVSSGSIVQNADGTLTHTPVENFVGDVTLTFAVSDAEFTDSTGNVILRYSAVNDDPVAEDDDGFSTPFGTALVIQAAALLVNDDDGDPEVEQQLSVLSVGPAVGGMVALVDGEITFTPNDGFNGAASFVYTLSDGNGGMDTGEVSILVGANTPPVANDFGVEVAEDGSVGVEIFANSSDADDDDLSVELGDPANGTVDFDGEEFRYTPNADYNGDDSFTYTVSDGKGGEATGTVSVNVTAVNDAPELFDAATSVDEDTPIIGFALAINAFDVDGDTLTFALKDNAANGNVSIDPDGTMNFFPDADFNGETSFTYTVDDGQDGTAEATFTVTVDPVNDAPVLVDVGPFGVDENTTDVGSITGTDVDSTDLTYDIIGGADGDLFEINATNGALTFKEAPDFEEPGSADGDNTYEIQVEVSDGDMTDDAFVFVNVTDEDEGPLLNPVFGTDGSDRDVTGTGEADIINSGAGRTDILTGLGGGDVFDFSTSSNNGTREVRKITDFNADEGDVLLLAEGVEITLERQVGGSTYLFLNEDRDIIFLQGVSDFTTDSLL